MPRPLVALIGCSSTKLDHGPVPARDLYTGELFQRSLAYAETVAHADAVHILSAEGGLVGLTDPLVPYDLALASLPSAERDAWGRRVADALLDRYAPGATFLVLAGSVYAEPLAHALLSRGTAGYGWEEPLRGLGIGDRLQFLGERVAGPRASTASASR